MRWLASIRNLAGDVLPTSVCTKHRLPNNIQARLLISPIALHCPAIAYEQHSVQYRYVKMLKLTSIFLGCSNVSEIAMLAILNSQRLA
jgi:hypothetical protein